MKYFKFIRKYLLVLGCLMSVVTAAACSSGATSSTTSTSTPTSTLTTSITTLTTSTTMTMPTTTTSTQSSTSTSTTTLTSKVAGPPVTINLVAQNIAFNMSTITVPSGASVTVNFNNMDGGIPHNFAVYQNIAGGQTKPVFVGDTIVGPKTIVYQFTAPSAAGDYFFDCDVHPTVMFGKFVVQ
jgi:plastocyanin